MIRLARSPLTCQASAGSSLQLEMLKKAEDLGPDPVPPVKCLSVILFYLGQIPEKQLRSGWFFCLQLFVTYFHN